MDDKEGERRGMNRMDEEEDGRKRMKIEEGVEKEGDDV